MCVCICVCECVYIYKYVYINMYMYIYIYISSFMERVIQTYQGWMNEHYLFPTRGFIIIIHITYKGIAFLYSYRLLLWNSYPIFIHIT